MSHYEKAFNHFESLPKFRLRKCESKGGCACIGCINPYSENLLKLYQMGELKRIVMLEKLAASNGIEGLDDFLKKQSI